MENKDRERDRDRGRKRELFSLRYTLLVEINFTEAELCTRSQLAVARIELVGGGGTTMDSQRPISFQYLSRLHFLPN